MPPAHFSPLLPHRHTTPSPPPPPPPGPHHSASAPSSPSTTPPSPTDSPPRRAPPAAPTNGSGPPGAALGIAPAPGPDTGGVAVGSVLDGGAAQKAGLEKGDVVTAIGAVLVKDMRGLARALAAHKPGDAVVVKVLRGDEERALKVVLG